MLRFLTLAMCFLCISAFATPVFAQISPFDLDDDDEEKTDTEKKKKVKVKVIKKKKSKKQLAKEKAEAAAKAEQEAKEKAATAKAKKEEEQEAEEANEEEVAEDENAENAQAEKAAAQTKEQADAAKALAAEKRKPEAKRLPQSPRIPLAANYDTVDLITINSVLAAGLTLTTFGTSLFGAPNASMRSPQLGSIDYDISISNHGDLQTGDPFLFGSLDIAAIAIPAGAAAYYLVSSVYYWSTDEPMLASQSLNVDHALFGYLNAIGWTAFAAGVTKLLVGREAPYSAFQRQAFGSEDPEQANTSFFSTTAAIGYAFAAFASRDLSDWLVHRKMADSSGASKFWLGRVVPTASMYLLMSLTAYSSIRNQQHYFSDVAIGALVGTLFGNLAYSSHFDSKGQPRVRYESALKNVATSPAIFTTPKGSPLIGASLRAEW